MRRTINLITAIGNPKFNNILKKEKDIKILEKDIFYREGILEFLEKNKKIDILIIHEKLIGEISIINLVKKIKIINDEIKIFFILEKNNEELNNFIKKENIKNIFFYENINIENLIIEIKKTIINKEEKLEKEIKELKNIINKKDEELLEYKNKNVFKIREKSKKQIIDEFKKNNNNKKFLIIGDKKCRKSLIIRNIKNILEIKKQIIFKEINIENINNIKKLNDIADEIIFVLEINLEKIKKNKKIINKILLDNNLENKNIKIILNKINKYSINKKIVKNYLKEFKIIGNIKLNKYCDFIFNNVNSYNKENKKLKKEYLKIIKNL